MFETILSIDLQSLLLGFAHPIVHANLLSCMIGIRGVSTTFLVGRVAGMPFVTVSASSIYCCTDPRTIVLDKCLGFFDLINGSSYSGTV